MLIFGNKFFAITQLFLGELGWNFSRELKKLLSNDWSREKQVVILICYLLFLIVWVTFGAKMGLAITPAQNGLGSPKLTNNIFGLLSSRNYFSQSLKGTVRPNKFYLSIWISDFNLKCFNDIELRTWIGTSSYLKFLGHQNEQKTGSQNA